MFLPTKSTPGNNPRGVVIKNTAVSGGIFRMPLKGRKGEKEIRHPKPRFRPKVQRRENVGGSLKTLGPIKSKRKIPLTNRNIIHKKRFVKYFVNVSIFMGISPQKYYFLSFLSWSVLNCIS